MPTDCRVRKLHIRTQDKAFVPRMTFVLEDALRTASFPGIPANGMVCFRRLDLGEHDPSVSSRVLAKKIDDLFRRVRPVKVTENAMELLTAPVVWFPDELSPYRFAIHLLSNNHRPLAWYWPAAIPGWSPKFTVKQSYHLILSQISQHCTGIRGMALALEPLLSKQTFHDVINTFDPKEISRLLINMGLEPSPDVKIIHAPWKTNRNRDDNPELEIALPVTFHVGDSIAKAVRMWSLLDPRTMLCACLALANMGEQTTLLKVSRLLMDVAKSQSMYGDMKGRSSGHGPEITTTDAELGKENQLSGLLSEMKQHVQAYSNIEKRSTVGSDTDLKTAKFEPMVCFKDRQKVQNQPDIAGLVTLKEQGFPEYWSGEFAGELSEYAGVVFLVPLMKRLGMDTLLEKYPEYADLKVAARIMFRCADLLSIPRDDPVLHLLGEKPKVSEQVIAFTAPFEWRKILYPMASETFRLKICRVKRIRGCRLLLDNKGRLVVGLWQSGNRDLFETWLSKAQKPFQQAAPQAWTPQRVVHNVVIAMSRYVKRYAGMNLLALMKRPGYIATTKTHLDVTIPFDRLDIRVRMAGLDINPGWVSWLGRVIQFHYV
jgi:hypothetical protein